MFCINHLKSFEDSDSLAVEWGLRFWLSILFPGSICMMLVGPWTTLCNVKSTGLSVVPFIPTAVTLLLASYDLSRMALYHGFVHSTLCSNCLQSTIQVSMKRFPEAYRVKTVFIIIVKHLSFSSSSLLLSVHWSFPEVTQHVVDVIALAECVLCCIDFLVVISDMTNVDRYK